MVPYGMGVPVLAMATRNFLVQALFGRHRKRLTTFLHENGLTVNERQAFACYLTTNFLTIWRLLALSRCSDDAYRRWVSVKGYEAFTQLREQGRPVLLYNSHYGAGKHILLFLMRQGHVVHSLDRFDLFSFFNIRTRGELVSINLGDRQSNFMLKQVFLARKVLQEGGILHIAGDGIRGLSGRAIPFLRRQRAFPASVAELALATDAVVIPTFGVLDTDGRIRMELLPPLEMPDTQLPHEERVMRIIEQYGSQLQAHWLASPGSIWKSEFKIYSDFPLLASAGTAQKE
jgi:lauroyl/myristoyl acyltransferase